MAEQNIFVHDDYCAGMCSEDVQEILARITALVTEAVLRSTAPTEGENTAA